MTKFTQSLRFCKRLAVLCFISKANKSRLPAQNEKTLAASAASENGEKMVMKASHTVLARLLYHCVYTIDTHILMDIVPYSPAYIR